MRLSLPKFVRVAGEVRQVADDCAVDIEYAYHEVALLDEAIGCRIRYFPVKLAQTLATPLDLPQFQTSADEYAFTIMNRFMTRHSEHAVRLRRDPSPEQKFRRW